MKDSKKEAEEAANLVGGCCGIIFGLLWLFGVVILIHEILHTIGIIK